MSESLNLDPRRWLTLAAVLTGTLVGTFGSSLVNVALPAIMEHFGVSISSAVWVQTIYILLVAVLMPLFGRLGDIHGYKRIYLAGMSLLAGASLLAALSPSFPLLVVARALQGIGNATTLPSVMAIVARVFPDRERCRAMGFWAAVNGAAHGLGPMIGGYLTQGWGWPAVFTFNASLSLLAVVTIWRLVPGDEKQAARPFDFIGAGTLTLAMITFMLNLTQGARWGWVTTPSLGLWVAFLGLMAAFLVTEKRVRMPFVELNLFTNHRYTATVGIIAAQFFCLFGMQLIVPLFLVQMQGRTSGETGLLAASLAVTSAIVAPLAGRLADSLGCRRLCIFGMGTVAAVGGLLRLWHPGTPSWQIVGTLVLLGLGMGLTQSPVAAAVTFTVTQDQLGVALGIFNMIRFIGASLGSTVFGAVLEGATTGSELAAYRLNFTLLTGVALTAAILALILPAARAGVSRRASET